MSLIKCSECGKEISDKATNCPNCGAPVVKSKNIDGCSGCLFIIIFFAFWVYFSNDSKPSSNSQKTDYYSTKETKSNLQIPSKKSDELKTISYIVNSEEYFLHNSDYNSMRRKKDSDDFGKKLFSGIYKHYTKSTVNQNTYVEKDTLKYVVSFNEKTQKYYWINISDTSYHSEGRTKDYRVNKLAFRFSKNELLALKNLAKNSLSNKNSSNKLKTEKSFNCMYFECRRVDASDNNLIWSPIMNFNLKIGTKSDIFIISPAEENAFEYEMGTSGFSAMVFDKKCLEILYNNLDKYIDKEKTIKNKNQEQINQKQSTSSIKTGERRITSNNFFGCRSKDLHSKLTEYVVNGDMEAFKKLFATGALTNECVLFNAGETVYVVDTAIFSGLVKIRRKGDIAEYWTNIEAIK